MSDQRWPVRIEKQLGLPFWIFLSPLAIVAAVDILPRALTGDRWNIVLSDVLLHSSVGAILVIMAVVLVSVWAATQFKGELVIDSVGISIRQRSGRYAYAWGDIDHLTETRTGVKVVLKSRSAAQNQYNIITARFLESPMHLRHLLSDGLDHFGVGLEPSGSSRTPGDDLRGIRVKSALLNLALMCGPFPALFFILAIFLSFSAYNDIHLREVGIRTEARVTRIYRVGCGKGCTSIDAEFVYSTDSGGPTYTGHGSLANIRDNNNPDLAFVRASGKAPVVYDPAHPEVVTLNFNDRLFHADLTKKLFTNFKIMGAVFGVFAVFVGLFFLPSLLDALKTPQTPTPIG